MSTNHGSRMHAVSLWFQTTGRFIGAFFICFDWRACFIYVKHVSHEEQQSKQLWFLLIASFFCSLLFKRDTVSLTVWFKVIDIDQRVNHLVHRAIREPKNQLAESFKAQI